MSYKERSFSEGEAFGLKEAYTAAFMANLPSFVFEGTEYLTAEAEALLALLSEKLHIFPIANTPLENNLLKLLLDKEHQYVFDAEVEGIEVPVLAYMESENSNPILLGILITDSRLFSKIKLLGIRG